MSVNRILVQCYANPIPFYQKGSTMTNQLGQVPFEDQIQSYQVDQVYNYPALMNDIFALQFHGYFVADAGITHTLYVCDHNKNIISAYTAAIAASPIYKGSQLISGNNYIDPILGTSQPLKSYMWAFSFNDLGVTVGGVYCIMLKTTYTGEPDILYYSEPIFLSDQQQETNLFQYTYESNNAQKNIVITGWWNDALHTVAYSPVWNFRCQAFIGPLDSKFLLIGYAQQNYNPLEIKTLQKWGFQLYLGEAVVGIPDYMVNTAGEVVTSDLWYFDGMPYILPFEGASNNIGKLWERKGEYFNPLCRVNTAIRRRFDQSRALVTPTPPFPTIGDYMPGDYDSSDYSTT